MRFTFTAKGLQRVVMATAAVLFILSLTQDAYCFDDCVGSLLPLLTGWLGLLTEVGWLTDWVMNSDQSASPQGWGSSFSWLANPLLILSWLVLSRNATLAIRFSLLAVLFASSFLFFDRVLANEAGHYRTVTGVKAGFWLWWLSAIATMAGSIVLAWYRKRHRIHDAHDFP
ncbi:MAG TPA: hypothetical protein VEB86_17465 [Chryseosolibacter sp.]|nr:hypothetical protein [Chryseosolibacter sp.]